MRALMLVLFAALLVTGCSGPTGVESVADLVIRGGQLLDMTSDEPSVRPIKGLVISGGKIARIIGHNSNHSRHRGHFRRGFWTE